MKQSIACIITDERERVLIAHRNPTGSMGGRWEFPRGKVEEGESHEQAICREMREEFGISVRPGALLTRSVFRHNEEERELFAYEVCIEPADIQKTWILSEHTEINWVSFEAIPLMHFVDSDKLIYELVYEAVKKRRIGDAAEP